MKNSRVVGAQPPPPQPVPTYKVLRPQKDGALDVSLLADTVSGIQCHWVTSDVSGAGVTRVCWQHERECPDHDHPFLWTGWVPVWDWQGKRKAVLRLAPKEYDVLVKALGVDLKWAGRRVKIAPTNAGRGRCVEVQTVQEGTYVPLNMGPHSLNATICLMLQCDHVPRQWALTEEQDGEGVIPCQ